MEERTEFKVTTVMPPWLNVPLAKILSFKEKIFLNFNLEDRPNFYLLKSEYKSVLPKQKSYIKYSSQNIPAYFSYFYRNNSQCNY